MKRLVFIVLHVLILVTGCEDKDYTSSLSVYNRTDSQIRINWEGYNRHFRVI